MVFSLIGSLPIFEPPHDVLRHDTPEEVKIYRDNLSLHRLPQFRALGEPELAYAFTEFITMKLRASNIDITSVITDEGKAFATYVKTILGTAQGLSRLLWGHHIEAPEMVVVLLDWTNFESWNNMQQETNYKIASSNMQGYLAEPIDSRAFDFQNNDSRHECFGQHFGDVRPGGMLHTHTAFYIGKFDTPSRDVKFVLPQQDSSSETLLEGTDAQYYEMVERFTDTDGKPAARSREVDTVQDNKQYARTFDLHWENFALHYYRSGAYRGLGPSYGRCLFLFNHCPSWGGGWEVPLSRDGADEGERAYCGVVGTLYSESARYLERISGKSFEEGGLAPLQSIATGGFDIFHVELHCLTSWQGSVLPPPWQPPRPMTDQEREKLERESPFYPLKLKKGLAEELKSST